MVAGLESESSADVIVVGSGSAALSAALTAAVGGASVLIFEKSAQLGGTSAMSGAGTWIPANHHMMRAGMTDSPEEALAYLRATAPAGWAQTQDRLWQAFVTNAPRMLEFIERQTPLRFELAPEADPMAEYAGGKHSGRTVSPRPLSRRILGRYADLLRGSTVPQIFTYNELLQRVQQDLFGTLLRMAPTLLRRLLTRTAGQGNALMTGLIKGCLDHGCRFETQARAVELLTDSKGREVRGVLIEQGAQRRAYTARRGVLLATGGFEWNAELMQRHFPGPIDFIGSPRTNEGDGHLMAQAVGAELAHMDQANINYLAPTRYEGRLHGIPLQFQLAPNAILVNRSAKRFVSEYRFNVGEDLDRRDASGQPVNLPVWLITDAHYLRRSVLLRWCARYDSRWIIRERSLAALADRIRLPSAALEATVARFNELCTIGRDDDFHRGETPLERERVGRGRALQPIVKPPFLAVSANRSILATKGGPRTNASGQVLRPDGSIIKGLFCAGVAMANPIGTRAVGSGTTIGPNMTWGYICALSMLGAQNS